jgi:NAD(P)-dependent dehydrogenase (short-subunit alcohol dehydrogenase family)
VLLQAALLHMKEGSSIINTSSVTAYKGSPKLVDYSAAKGAQVHVHAWQTHGSVTHRVMV